MGVQINGPVHVLHFQGFIVKLVSFFLNCKFYLFRHSFELDVY